MHTFLPGWCACVCLYACALNTSRWGSRFVQTQHSLLYVSNKLGLVWPQTAPPLSCIRPKSIYECGRLNCNSWSPVSPYVLQEGTDGKREAGTDQATVKCSGCPFMGCSTNECWALGFWSNIRGHSTRGRPHPYLQECHKALKGTSPCRSHFHLFPLTLVSWLNGSYLLLVVVAALVLSLHNKILLDGWSVRCFLEEWKLEKRSTCDHSNAACQMDVCWDTYGTDKSSDSVVIRCWHFRCTLVSHLRKRDGDTLSST